MVVVPKKKKRKRVTTVARIAVKVKKCVQPKAPEPSTATARFEYHLIPNVQNFPFHFVKSFASKREGPFRMVVVISWPISVIVDTRLQSKHSKRDKLEGATTTKVRGEGGKIFLTYELFGSTILRFTRRSTGRRDRRVGDSGAITIKFWVQSKFLVH